MAGREKGLPIKWVNASIKEPVLIGKPGVKFDVAGKWAKKKKKLGTLIVSVGGLRWRPRQGRFIRKSWDEVSAWFDAKNA